MSDLDDALGEAELVEGLERKRLSGKKLIMAAGGGVGGLILLIIIGSFVFGGSDDHDEPPSEVEQLAEEVAERNKAAAKAARVPEEAISMHFVDVDEMLFNLNTGGDGESYLRMKVKLEVDRESFVVKVNEQMPRIRDEMNTFMREIRPADLEGGTGLIFVKEELLRRINQSLAPTRVVSILVESFSIQG